MDRKSAAAFAAGCVLSLCVALSADERQMRTFLLEIDGKEQEITTGQEISVSCSHAEGQVHRIGAEESTMQRFVKRGLQFGYPSTCTLTYDTAEQEMAVQVRHPAGPVVRVSAVTRELDLKDALERHASSIKMHLSQGGAGDIKVTEVVSSLGGAVTPGRQVTCVLLGEPRATEIYYLARGGRSYTVTLDFPLERAEAAQVLWGAVAESLRFE